MSEAVINASRDKRAQYHKRLEAITEAASKREGAEQALTDAEAKSFEKLTGKIKDISKDIARLEKDAERAAKAEEALAEVEIGSLLAVVSVLHAHQVHVMFRAKLVKPEFGAGPESEEVGLYDEAEVPWADLAFPSGEYTLRRYFEDRSRGVEDHHFSTINRRMKT